jgi:hypothetical protein
VILNLSEPNTINLTKKLLYFLYWLTRIVRLSHINIFHINTNQVSCSQIFLCEDHIKYFNASRITKYWFSQGLADHQWSAEQTLGITEISQAYYKRFIFSVDLIISRFIGLTSFLNCCGQQQKFETRKWHFVYDQ